MAEYDVGKNKNGDKMNEDRKKFDSEDLQKTMEVPLTRSNRKEPSSGIFDPWNLNNGGPSDSILDSIAKSLQEVDKMPETITVSNRQPVEEKPPEPEIKPESNSEPAEEPAEEIDPKPDIKNDDTQLLPGIPEEEKKAESANDETMLIPVVSAEEEPKQEEESKEVEEEPEEPDKQETDEEITRQKATGGRLWPPVLMSSIFMIIACVITLSVGIMPVLVELGFARGMTQIMSPVLNAGEPTAYTNVLLVGVDEDGYRTDTMMIATYDNEAKKVYIMQLPRDTYVANNGRRDKKLNSAYYSGIDQLRKEVRMAYGIETHKYVEVYLEGFRMLIDAIGGVEMDVPINMVYDDPYQDFHIYLLKGPQVLDGDKAEQFVRFRQNNDGSGYPRGDLQRMEAQKEFVMATVKQMVSIDGLSNINELIKIAKDNLKTDLSFEEIYNYCTSILTLEEGGIEFVAAPGEAANLPGGSYFVVDYDEARKVAENYFYATNVTMSDMKKVVVQPEETDRTESDYDSDYDYDRDYDSEEEPDSRPVSRDDEEEEPEEEPEPPRTNNASSISRDDEEEEPEEELEQPPADEPEEIPEEDTESDAMSR